MSDVKSGSVLEMNGQPYVVTHADFMRAAQGKPSKRTKLKNLIDGRVLEHTFKHGDKIAEADILRRKADYLYHDESGYAFMDAEHFDQFTMSPDDLGDVAKFLKDGLSVDVLYYKNNPVAINPPKKVEFEIVETTDAVKGDTVSGSSMTKKAIVETGFEIDVPMFIKQGEIVRVNTETGEYVERAN